MTSKDHKIIQVSEEKNIPIFVFTAKDIFSVSILRKYLRKCVKAGCPTKHTQEILDRIEEFTDFQRERKDEVKYPD